MAIAVAASASSCKSSEAQSGGRTAVDAIVLKDTTITTEYSFPATISGLSDVAIYPQVSGRITSVMVKEGQLVSKGDVLFEIDDIPYAAQYQSALAQLEVSKAQLETARLTYQSKENLYDKGIISEYQLKLAGNDVVTAEAIVGQSQAALNIAANNLSFTKVRTMGRGYIGSLPYKVGSLVGPEIPAPLTVVSDNSSIYADFSISENIYLTILDAMAAENITKKADIPLKLRDNLGKIYEREGSLHSISGLISRETGSIPVRAIFPNSDGKLLSGGACSVIISTDGDCIAIPRSAIKEIQDKLFVFVIKDGKLAQTEIRAERISSTHWSLLPGDNGVYPLKAGDMITATTNRLYDGEEVEVTE